MREQLEGRRSVQWLMARALLVSESIRVGRHKADRQTGPYSALRKPRIIYQTEMFSFMKE